MPKKYHQDVYIPKNPEKYVGLYPIRYLSSWERTVMEMFDSNPNIISWASQSLKIPYQNPFTGKHTVYIPDFVVVYQDKDKIVHTEIVEVKPLKESVLSEAKSLKNKAAVVLNEYKWAAAKVFAEQHNMKFKVLTEFNIYNNPSRKS